jgi:hypothetical protein
MLTKLDPKDIDAAFAAAPLALRIERTDADRKITKKFLLHNLDYYSMHRKYPRHMRQGSLTASTDLQMYLHTGIGLPLEDTAFHTLFPKEHLEKLIQIDGAVYEVRGNSTCYEKEAHT